MKCKRCKESFSFWRWLFHNCRTYTMNSSGILRVDTEKLVRSKRFKKQCEDAKKALSPFVEQCERTQLQRELDKIQKDQMYFLVIMIKKWKIKEESYFGEDIHLI